MRERECVRDREGSPWGAILSRAIAALALFIVVRMVRESLCVRERVCVCERERKCVCERERECVCV